MSTQTVLRLSRRVNVRLETALEGILFNEIPLSTLDYTRETTLYDWKEKVGRETLLLWYGKASECINLTALMHNIMNLLELAECSTFSIDKVITKDKFLITLTTVCTSEKDMRGAYDRYCESLSTLSKCGSNTLPIDTRDNRVPELDYFEFQAKLILTF